MENGLKLFENKKVRAVWNETEQEWFFSVVDVVGILTDSPNPTDYLKKMRKRDPELGTYIGTNCPQVAMETNGKKRKTLAANMECLFRIIQSIPSPKAEPVKLWLAKVAKERVEEEIDPQKAIDRARNAYRRKGFSEEWINARMKGIETRNALTSEWKEHGVRDRQYGMLTDIIHCGTFEVSIKQHKTIKGLTKENLRDNMTLVESALTTLAEATATEITRSQNPVDIEENKEIAKTSGKIAGDARRKIELKTGKKVVSEKNAKHLIEEESQRRLGSNS